jgi:hypothetical protein
MKILKVAITIIFMLTLVSTARAQLDERMATAAYIYNFLRLTEWPSPPKQPFNLCVLGHTTIDDELHLLEGKEVRKDVTISINHVSIDEDIGYCNAIYFDSSKRKLIDVLLRKLHGLPALTISDADGLTERGIMIEITSSNRRLAFDINLKAARHVKMDFNARLLKLARFVTTQ